MSSTTDDFLFIRSGRGTQWANYRRQADIGFVKIFDFMIDMASFNVQTNNFFFQFWKKNAKIF
jgi:hypothetical protein